VFAYDLELQIDRDHKRITGREKIRLRSAADGLAAVVFPRNGITIQSVTSARGDALPTLTTSDQVEMRLPAVLSRGQEVSLVVEYSATEPKGVVFHADAVYTTFHTCHWMLCRDRPDDKATLTLAITAPAGLTMIASGAPVGGPRPAGAAGREVWTESVPSSPYLFGFAIGKFSRIARKHRGVALEYFAAGVDDTRLKRMFADDDRMLDFFVEKAGRPLPRSFYRQVVVDGDAAQEMTSFSILGRSHLDLRLTDPTEDWLVAHEMAHQFWGNLVTCADWSHFWLNEGLTVFMVAAYKERRWGRQAYEHELGLLRTRHQAAVDAKFDVPLTFGGEYPSLRMKRAIVYSKGALFVDRLRETMGERPFWAALKKYTRRFAGRAVVSQDFQRVFAAETDKDLSGLFDEWVYGRRR
jgi:aminopeptidase N